MSTTRRDLLALAALGPLVSPASWAQAWPSKPFTIVVPATPGGAIDITARLIGAKLTAAWGQPVNIDNKGGAAGAGIAGYDTSTWGGLLAPAGTPKDVIARLNAEVNKALAAPDVRERLASAGIEPAGGSPAQFGEFISSEMQRWAKVAQTAGLQPE